MTHKDHKHLPEIPQIRLSEFFSLFSPTHVLGTTYTISLTFFESVVFPHIEKGALRKCLILCDEFGFRRAATEAGALTAVSNSYMVVVPPASRTLHSKVWLMANQDRVALLVGSGNLTQSGFMQNNELFDVLEISSAAGSAVLLEDVRLLLDGLDDHCSDFSRKYTLLKDFFTELKMICQNIPVKMAEHGWEEVRLLTSFHGPIIEQIASLVSDCDLYVAAPYFGGSLQGLSLLQRAVNARNTVVFPGLDADDAVDAPIQEIVSLPNTRICALKLSESERFSHLKLYGFRTPGEGTGWLFNGSVNCTKAALTGENIEAGVLRKVSMETLQSYFTEGKSVPLPKSRPVDYVDSQSKWLSICAADLGNVIEMVIVSTVQFPLSNVTIGLKNGAIKRQIVRPQLFVNGPTERLLWSELAVEKPKPGSVSLIDFDGLDSKGFSVRGACYVDDFVTLSSDPAHRSAFRVVLEALGAGEEVITGNVAAVFNLLDVFRPGGFLDKTPGNHDADGHNSDNNKLLIEKTSLWPPVLLTVDVGSIFTSHRFAQTYWLQRIMELLFTTNRKDHEQTPEEDQEDDDKKLQTPKPTVSILKKDWQTAQECFWSLERRLRGLVIDQKAAAHIVPVSLAALLVMLAFRAKYQKTVDDKHFEEPLFAVLNDFLSMLFHDRPQGADYVVPRGCRYRHKTFPTISEDIQTTFNIQPPPDLCSIIFVIFAYTNTWVSLGFPGKFQKLAWLRFLRLAGKEFEGDYLQREYCEAIYKQYLTDEAYPILWSDIEGRIDGLLALRWEDDEGYSDLGELYDFSVGKTEAPDLKLAHLKDVVEIFKSRVERKMQLFYRIDRFVDYCIAPGCSKAYISDPAKGRLQALSPVICETCGAVLIPDELYSVHPRFC